MKSLLAGLGFAVVAVLATVLYYEGLRLPLVGQVIDGAIARRLENYVILSEKTDADTRAAREEHDRLAAQHALEEARKRAAAAEQLKDKAHAELEKRIADDAGGGCSWTSDDDQWLRHH